MRTHPSVPSPDGTVYSLLHDAAAVSGTGQAPSCDDGPLYLTLPAAADLGYAAVPTLRSWISQGLLPAYRIGGRVKVRPQDLEDLVVPVVPAAAAQDQALTGEVLR